MLPFLYSLNPQGNSSFPALERSFRTLQLTFITVLRELERA